MLASARYVTLLAQPAAAWGYTDGPGHPLGWWAPLFMLLWLSLIGVAVWLVARTLRPRERAGAERARDILAERFARGELSAEEYRERLGELR